MRGVSHPVLLETPEEEMIHIEKLEAAADFKSGINDHKRL